MRTVCCSSHLGAGVSARGEEGLPKGVSAWWYLGGVCPGGCLLCPGGVSAREVSARGGLPGGCLPKGVSAQGGVCAGGGLPGGICPGGVFARGCLPPPRTESQTPVKT